MRTITFLDQTGDITISWDQVQDEKILSVIKKKMDEGMTFFIVQDINGREWSSKATSVDDIAENACRSVRINDSDIEQLFSEGAISVRSHEMTQATTVTRASTPEQVIENDSVGVRPLRGG